ncbi:hypothetical protein [Pseudoclavibacter sp. AY1F1]|uniref:hypothetical protein n=1 Tax=Pseudoclavibacter sp. AY1F1 TaxID=2080583 RepID=UPI0011B08272|nr:hypothetical protein [Pseudoclavibacter sp. AY1F1]
MTKRLSHDEALRFLLGCHLTRAQALKVLKRLTERTDSPFSESDLRAEAKKEKAKTTPRHWPPEPALPSTRDDGPDFGF